MTNAENRSLIAPTRSWIASGSRKPAVDRLSTVPVFAPDGSLVVEPGYFPEGRLFLVPTVTVPPIPPTSSESDLKRAVSLIVDDVPVDSKVMLPSISFSLHGQVVQRSQDPFLGASQDALRTRFLRIRAN